MALVHTVQPSDIATEMGDDPAELSSVEMAQILRWITDAAFLVERGLGDVTPDTETLDYVIRQAVLGVADGPRSGVASESVQIDDAQTMTRYERAGRRRIEILPEWWEMLGVATARGQAMTIDMTPADLTIHAVWCDLYLGGTTCSCGASIAGYPIFEL